MPEDNFGFGGSASDPFQPMYNNSQTGASSDAFGSFDTSGAVPPPPPPNIKSKGRRARKVPKQTKIKSPAISANARRTMRVYQVGFIVAVVAFVGILLATRVPSKNIYVVEANATINPLSVLNSGDLVAVSVPKASVVAGAITNPNGLVAIKNAEAAFDGKLAQYLIPIHQQITSGFIFTNSITNPNLNPNTRLLSITASTSTAVGGALLPGQNVDIVAVYPTSNTPQPPVLVASDVKIIADSPATSAVASGPDSTTATTTQTSGPPSGGNGVYVVSVPISNVYALIQADASAKLYLLYRGANASPLPASGTVGILSGITSTPTTTASTSPTPYNGGSSGGGPNSPFVG